MVYVIIPVSKKHNLTLKLFHIRRYPCIESIEVAMRFYS
ncbi:hypothetical protein APHNP_0781 [Anaplasma phagocytophilum str. ApNP]|uniref:Uncharacterized protein n=1 Tax=Anaplasma phagocytophilum str. ApNP TaxID=1359153 RepID=A0A0F3NH49_ANAPH|nr:hypothetical protein APHNP_0781 [Anaplasma phagocytophilum str. ApNP]